MTSSTSSTSAKSASSSNANKGFRTSCLNCRRRKIKCDSKRPVCTACLSSIVYGDCEYADAGATLTQTQCLEEQIALLESRIQRLEDPDNPEGAVFLTDPYAPHPPISSCRNQLPPDKLSESARDNLIQISLQHRTEIGFFLDPIRFLGTLSASDTNRRPLTALMSAVLLWGSHLSSSRDAKQHEANFVTRAVNATAQGLASGHPQAVMHSIQAEILLAHYFYRQARFLEGKYHASVTVSLALSAKLHKIRSIDGPSDLPNATSLSPPTDAVEEGERINGFWAVFILNKCWAAADDSPSPFQCSFSPEARIDAPWPLEIESYAQLSRSPHFRTTSTVHKFLEHQHDSGTSALALHAKAAVLYEQASRAAYTYRPDMSQDQASRFFTSYNALQTTIDDFSSKLTSPSTAEDVATHALVHAAIVDLHAPFLSQNPASRGRLAVSMRAMEALIRTVDIPAFTIVDSIIGIILARSCEVLIREISALRSAARSEPLRILESMLTVMDKMKTRYPVISEHVSKLRDAQALGVLGAAIESTS